MSESSGVREKEAFDEEAEESIEVRSPEGKLLFKWQPENHTISMVQKRKRYDVHFGDRRYECKMRRKNRKSNKTNS